MYYQRVAAGLHNAIVLILLFCGASRTRGQPVPLHGLELDRSTVDPRVHTEHEFRFMGPSLPTRREVTLLCQTAGIAI